MYQIEVNKDYLLPRERLQFLGPEKLSNQELLAILLRTGTKKNSVLELSLQIINQLKSLADFKHMSLQELQLIEGIGVVKSIEIKAMLEFSDRIQLASYSKQEHILSSEKMAKKMMLSYGDKKQEHLVAIYLDTQNRIIEEKVIFIGSVRRSIAEPREILYHACKNMATSLIICHNHPSGSIEPSQNDIHFTQKIKRSCEDIGILCLDHIIVTKHHYYSFREETDLI